MPREQINYPKYRIEYSESCPKDCSEQSEHGHGVPRSIELPVTLLHVGWNKTGDWVQVGIEASKDALRRALDDETNESDLVMLWTDVLDRASCNRLVRIARNARDSAYGKDE